MGNHKFRNRVLTDLIKIIKSNEVDKFLLFLEKKSININYLFQDGINRGFTILHIAVRFGSPKFVKYVLDQIDLSLVKHFTSLGDDPLRYALKYHKLESSYEIVKKIQENLQYFEHSILNPEAPLVSTYFSDIDREKISELSKYPYERSNFFLRMLPIEILTYKKFELLMSIATKEDIINHREDGNNLLFYAVILIQTNEMSIKTLKLPLEKTDYDLKLLNDPGKKGRPVIFYAAMLGLFETFELLYNCEGISTTTRAQGSIKTISDFINEQLKEAEPTKVERKKALEQMLSIIEPHTKEQDKALTWAERLEHENDPGEEVFV